MEETTDSFVSDFTQLIFKEDQIMFWLLNNFFTSKTVHVIQKFDVGLHKTMQFDFYFCYDLIIETILLFHLHLAKWLTGILFVRCLSGSGNQVALTLYNQSYHMWHVPGTL